MPDFDSDPGPTRAGVGALGLGAPDVVLSTPRSNILVDRSSGVSSLVVRQAEEQSRYSEVLIKYVDRDHFDRSVDGLSSRIDALLDRTGEIREECIAIHAAAKLPRIDEGQT